MVVKQEGDKRGDRYIDFLRHALCAALVVGLICSGSSIDQTRNWADYLWPIAAEAQADNTQVSSGIPLSAQEVYEQTANAIFYLKVYQKDGTLKTVGTGFLLSNGVALTANHVVAGGDRFEAIFDNLVASEGPKTILAKIIQQNPQEDIAILQLENLSGLKEVQTSIKLTTLKPKHGEIVYAIGYPLKETKVITAGLINAPLVKLSGKVRMLSSATVAPGMSGGPLLNNRGELVGLISGSTKTMNEIHVIIPVSTIQKNLGGQ